MKLPVFPAKAKEKIGMQWTIMDRLAAEHEFERMYNLKTWRKLVSTPNFDMWNSNPRRG